MMQRLRMMAACAGLLACMGMKVDAQRIAVEIDGRRMVLPIIGGECVLFDEDVCLQPHQYMPVDDALAMQQRDVGPRAQGDVDDVINLVNQLWKPGDITFDLHSALSGELILHVLDAVNEWNTKTDFNLRVVYPWEMPMVMFKPAEKGCRAPQGRPDILPARVELASSCDLQSVLHEIGHVLGMQHEHQRVDRSLYLTMRRDTLAFIRDHIGAKQHATALRNLKRENPAYEINLPFDMTSVMMYGSYPRNDPDLFHELYSRSLPLFTDRAGRLVPRPTFGLTGKDVSQANQLVQLGAGQ